MTLTRWQRPDGYGLAPWRRGYSLPDDLGQLLQSFGGVFDSPLDASLQFPGGWLPAVDVHDSKDAVTVKAELPGMKKEDIKVDVDGNRVTISGETKRESEQKEGNTVVRSERYVGQLYRSFTLEQDVDDAKAEAKYQDGVLELSLPKKANNGAKKLVIN